MTRFGVALLVCSLVGVGVGVGIVLGDARPVAACSCAALPDANALAGADAAFVGTVTGVDAPDPAEILSSPDPVIWTFTVERVFKGDVRSTQEVVSPLDSAACGLELEEDQRYLVFGDISGDPGFLPVPAPGQLVAHLCNGTQEAASGETPESFPPGSVPRASPVGQPGPVDDASQTIAISWPWLALAALGAVAALGVLAMFVARRSARST